MNQDLKNRKKEIRTFLREQYSDANLTRLLGHCRDGKFVFTSCCCFIGLITADHYNGELKSATYPFVPHLQRARAIPGANEAEAAVAYIAKDDGVRRRFLIPMVMAEIRRRNKLTMSTMKEEPVHENTAC